MNLSYLVAWAIIGTIAVAASHYWPLETIVALLVKISLDTSAMRK